jgi:predicted methyltransferase MtxX (methanogen marker protein 4)
MASTQTDIVKLVDELSTKKRNRIAVGVLHDYPLSVESLKKVKDRVEIVVVGPKKIDDFEFVESSDAHDLVRLAKDNKVDAVFRGNFDAVEVYEAIHEIFEFNGSVVGISPMVIKKVQSIEENLNGLRCLLPASPSNYKGVKSKIENIDANIKFFESFGIKPRIGLLSAGKPIDVLEGIPEIDKTITEAEFLAKWYTDKGYEAKHFNHQVEYAVINSEIVVYPDGISGNQGLRAVLFFGDNDMLGGISTNLPFVYAQTAEAFRDWEKLLLFLNGYLNRDLKE